MIDLIAIRETAGLSRQNVADQLGLSERSGRVTVAQMEARDDWTLSKLGQYIAAVGGVAELVVTVNGEELRFKVTA